MKNHLTDLIKFSTDYLSSLLLVVTTDVIVTQIINYFKTLELLELLNLHIKLLKSEYQTHLPNLSNMSLKLINLMLINTNFLNKKSQIKQQINKFKAKHFIINCIKFYIKYHF